MYIFELTPGQQLLEEMSRGVKKVLVSHMPVSFQPDEAIPIPAFLIRGDYTGPVYLTPTRHSMEKLFARANYFPSYRPGTWAYQDVMYDIDKRNYEGDSGRTAERDANLGKLWITDISDPEIEGVNLYGPRTEGQTQPLFKVRIWANDLQEKAGFGPKLIIQESGK